MLSPSLFWTDPEFTESLLNHVIMMLRYAVSRQLYSVNNPLIELPYILYHTPYKPFL